MVGVRKLRMGLVGGGDGAFIGAVHRMAAELDGQIALACGAFSSDPARSRAAGTARYGLPAARSYGSTAEMFATEAALPSGERMDFVTIATPNHTHFDIAHAALAAGFDVVCDKPATLDVAQARSLRDLVRMGDRIFVLTHNYTGYPMVKEARRLVREGRLGPIRRVCVEYLQGWLAKPIDAEGQKQASWRTDPARSGAAGCMGDIGSHAESLVEYVTGLRIESLCADLHAFVPGRRLDDDGSVLLRFAGGARGTLVASQVAIGEENNLRLRVYGEHGALDWSQQEPNTLTLRHDDRPAEVRRTGGPGVGPDAVAATRLPSGHPEGFLEAFANLYRGFAAAYAAGEGKAAYAAREGKAAHAAREETAAYAAGLDVPGIDDALRGMQFIETVVESSRRGGVWLSVPSQ